MCDHHKSLEVVRHQEGSGLRLLATVLVFDQASDIAKCQLAQVNVERSATEARFQATAEAFENRLHLLQVIPNTVTQYPCFCFLHRRSRENMSTIYSAGLSANLNAN